MSGAVKLQIDGPDQLDHEARSSVKRLRECHSLACTVSIKRACLFIAVTVLLFEAARYQHRRLARLSSANLDLPGVPQEPLRGLSDQEAKLRANAWKRPPPDPSLLRFVNELPASQRRVRDWLRDTRPEWERGTSIGIDRSDPPEPIRSAAPVSRPRKGFPKANEGPGHFEDGDPRKYYELVQEWQLGRKEPVCQPAPWQQTYRELHHNMLSGQAKPRFLLAQCVHGLPHGCGGLADRMLNVVTTFLYSLLTNRGFLVLWEYPSPIDLVFDSVNIDWSFPFDPATSASSHHLFNPNESDVIAKALNVNNLNKKPAFLDKAFERRLFDLGFKHDTIWACIIDYLFRPKYAALQYIAEYSSYFALPSIYSIGIQIRTGDSSMHDPTSDNSTIDMYAPLFRCAEQVAQAYARPSQKVVYFLVSDSMALKQDAVKRMPDKVLTTNFAPRHVEHCPTLEIESMTESIVTSWIFSHTDFHIVTPKSGFGRLPVWRRGKQGRLIEIYGRTGDNISHCGLDTSISRLSELAQTWSFG